MCTQTRGRCVDHTALDTNDIYARESVVDCDETHTLTVVLLGTTNDETDDQRTVTEAV